MAQVVWSERAVADLEQIGSYIAKDSLRYAEMVVGKLFSRTEILKTNPHLGRMVPEFSNACIRELIEGSYRIVYQMDSSQDAVQIIPDNALELRYESLTCNKSATFIRDS